MEKIQKTRLKILSSVWPRVIFFAIRDDFLETIFLKTILHETIIPETNFLKTILLNFVNSVLAIDEYEFVQLRWIFTNYVVTFPTALEEVLSERTTFRLIGPR